MGLGLGIGLGFSKSTKKFETIVLSDMTDESPFTLVNGEFTSEEHDSGTQCVKLNIPAGGSASMRFDFEEWVNMRTNSLSFRIKAINENVDALSIGSLTFGSFNSIGVASSFALTSGCPLTAFLPLNEWLWENVVDESSSRTTLYNVYNVTTYIILEFTASAANAVTLYIDTIALHPQPAIPPRVLLSADDGYLNYGALGGAVADTYGIKLSAAVTKDFIIAGEHTLGEQVRPVMDWDELDTYAALGHEVSNHSKTHPNVTGLNEAEIIDESKTWGDELVAAGHESPGVYSWIPPNGGVSDLSANVIAANMRSQRNPKLFNKQGIMGIVGWDIFNLSSRIYEESTIQDIDDALEAFAYTNCLLIWYGHEIETDADPVAEYATHIDVFTYMCQKIQALGIESVTYKDLINFTHNKSDYTWDYETYQRYLTANAAAFLAANIYIPDTQMVRYDMEELSPTTLFDLSGNNIDGTTTDIVYGTSPQRIIKNAGTSKVALPTSTYIGNSECTIIAAIKINDIPDAYQGFYFESRNANAFFRMVLEVGASSDVRIRARSNLGTVSASLSSNTFVVGEWFIAIGRRDLTSDPGSAIYKISCFYQDGRRASQDSSPFAGDAIDDTEPQKIELFESAEGIRNELSDLIVYKKLLTDDEVLSTVRDIAPEYNIKGIL